MNNEMVEIEDGIYWNPKYNHDIHINHFSNSKSIRISFDNNIIEYETGYWCSSNAGLTHNDNCICKWDQNKWLLLYYYNINPKVITLRKVDH